MAENKTDQTPELTSSIHGEKSDSGENPTISTTTTTSSEYKLRNKDPETDPQPKRRKNCPSALDKFEAIKSSSNSSFSFTFDTKVGGAPEFTPKFGSFNLVAASPDNDRCCQIPAIKAKAVELEEAEVIVEREVVEVLSGVDGIKSVE
ncbi:unnamed protein product [Ilex paraguariensis]|uniref:Uncharacterized protein n=1 Tax=Ilex paraguariensis TaxID=185542 RepID=A0ABC8TL46_9AQUA